MSTFNDTWQSLVTGTSHVVMWPYPGSTVATAVIENMSGGTLYVKAGAQIPAGVAAFDWVLSPHSTKTIAINADGVSYYWVGTPLPSDYVLTQLTDEAIPTSVALLNAPSLNGVGPLVFGNSNYPVTNTVTNIPGLTAIDLSGWRSLVVLFEPSGFPGRIRISQSNSQLNFSGFGERSFDVDSSQTVLAVVPNLGGLVTVDAVALNACGAVIGLWASNLDPMVYPRPGNGLLIDGPPTSVPIAGLTLALTPYAGPAYYNVAYNSISTGAGGANAQLGSYNYLGNQRSSVLLQWSNIGGPDGQSWLGASGNLFLPSLINKLTFVNGGAAAVGIICAISAPLI